MAEPPINPLLAAYIERRGDLVRYFRVRLRSQEEAEDLVHDLYLKIVRLPEQQIFNPIAYLYRLGSNLMLDRLKQQTRAARRDSAWRASETTTMGDEDIAPATAADEALAARQRLGQILAAIETLPAPTRQAFRLHKLEGLSHAETAAVMGVSRSSVEKYLMASLACILRTVGR